MPVDVQALGADFLAFSAHKMLGPTGVGVLWGRREILEDLDPFLGGGEMISTVTREESSWAALPHKFEAGTPNIADVIAFGPALRYLTELGMEAVRAHEIEIIAYTLDRLQGLEACNSTAPRIRGGAAAWRPSTTWTSTLTTSAPSWTGKAWPSAPATTAPSPDAQPGGGRHGAGQLLPLQLP